MINFLHTYTPHPILFSWGHVSIHWYGVMLALGFGAGITLLHYLFRRYDRDEEIIYTIVLYIVVGAIIGARLYYVIYAWPFYANNLIDIFKIWEGGLAIHGVMIGGIIGLYLFTKKFWERFWALLDLLAPCLVLGQVIGRWGNYFNQELFGRPTGLPWGIPIQDPPAVFSAFTYFHPTFLYESLLNVMVLCGLLWLHRYALDKRKFHQGTIFLIYVIAYSVIRFSMEFLRLDYSPLFFGVRWAQVMSSLLIIGSLLLIIKPQFLKRS